MWDIMKTMVFDVPAESGGALTILGQYYERAINDSNKEWIFVISTPYLKECKNIKVINFPWVKKSWLHRIVFDKLIAYKLVQKYRVDEVLSLQNVVIPNVKVKQTLYLHQPLPFVEKRYSITSNYKFWVYQNIISRMIYKSLKEADKIIVQTEWMLNAVMNKVKIEREKISVEQPKFNIKVSKKYESNNDKNTTFFYPASGLEYKNHRIIVESTKELVSKGITNFKVILTLKGDESGHIKHLYRIVKSKGLPIDFIGQVNLNEVYEYYSKTILLFPSYIETFGLPLLEARLHETPILASNCEFSREILEGYKKVNYFDPFDSKGLHVLMKHHLQF